MEDIGEGAAADEEHLYEDVPAADVPAEPPQPLQDPDSSFLKHRSIASEIGSSAPPASPHPELAEGENDKAYLIPDMDEHQKQELAQLLLQIQEMELQPFPQLFLDTCEGYPVACHNIRRSSLPKEETTEEALPLCTGAICFHAVLWHGACHTCESLVSETFEFFANISRYIKICITKLDN